MPSADAAVTEFLRTAPNLSMPRAVAVRLRAVLDDEILTRRAVATDPDPETTPPLKSDSPLWHDVSSLDDGCDI